MGSQHKRWTELITKEFHNQGDKEIALGLECSPLCNKNEKKIAQGQVGFIKYVVFPLYDACKRFFVRDATYARVILHRLSQNRIYWENEARMEESILSRKSDTNSSH